jgi:DnaJ-class molecular chaperone
MSPRAYYADLGLLRNATQEQIKEAFQALAAQLDNDTTAFRRVQEAYVVLSNANARAEYDRTGTLSTLFDDGRGLTRTRTAAYNAEEAARGRARGTDRDGGHGEYPWFDQRSVSPPVTGEERAHDIAVLMTSHPATSQNCTLRTGHWRKQAGSHDKCIFCMEAGDGGSRCPGCQALACSKCLHQIMDVEVEIERAKVLHGFSS